MRAIEEKSRLLRTYLLVAGDTTKTESQKPCNLPEILQLVFHVEEKGTY